MADSAVVTELQLTDAPASAPNNLRCNGSSLMYVSKNAVALVEDAGGDASSFRPRASGYGSKASTVDAATWVPTPAGSVIVVMTGGRDISFYRDCINDASADEEHGAATGTAQMLFSYTLKSNAASANGTTLRVMDGATCAAAVMSADDSCLICIGCNNGDVVVVSCRGGGSSFSYESSFRAHDSAPITHMSSDYHCSRGTRCSTASSPTNKRFELATVDIDGNLCLWTSLSARNFVRRCKHTIASFDESIVDMGKTRGSSCVSLCVRGPWTICGMANGEVLCLINDGENAHALRLLWCVVAHSRYLSAMDIHPFHNVLVTAAEDGTVCVWQLHMPDDASVAGGHPERRFVDILHSSKWTNVMVVGVAFCGQRCDMFAMVGYDEKTMKVLKWE